MCCMLITAIKVKWAWLAVCPPGFFSWSVQKKKLLRICVCVHLASLFPNNICVGHPIRPVWIGAFPSFVWKHLITKTWCSSGLNLPVCRHNVVLAGSRFNLWKTFPEEKCCYNRIHSSTSSQYHIYCFTALSPRSKCSKAPFPLLVIVRVKDWCRCIDFMTVEKRSGEEEWGRKTLLREKWRGGGGGVRTCENQSQQQFQSWKPHLTTMLESFTVSCV